MSTATQTITSTARSTPVKVSLHVTSDTICPWCYIGFAQINRAIQQAKDNKLPLAFDIEFAPFMLDPTLPKEGGQPKMERYVEKMGETKAKQVVERLNKAGKELGIDFHYNGLTSQTIRSHRLLMKAYSAGGQAAQQILIKEIFKGYFEEDRDVGDVAWLASCAEKAGLMSSAEATKFLESSELEDEVLKQIDMAQRMGISGVPFTIVNRKWALSGAQPSDVFYQIFEKLAADSKAKIEAADGDSCA